MTSMRACVPTRAEYENAEYENAWYRNYSVEMRRVYPEARAGAHAIVMAIGVARTLVELGYGVVMRMVESKRR